MKKHLFLLSFAEILFSGVYGQCIPAIPSNAVVVDSTQVINGGFDPVWVCKGDTLFTGGGFHNIYLEDGSVLNVSGGIDSIYVKKNATLFMNGGIHYIYYENYTDLNIAGGIPTLDSCLSMSFNYTNAPANGCFTGPVAAFQSGDSVICAGNCINFSSTGVNATTWHWTFPGATPFSDTVSNPQNICYPVAGSYDVTLVVSDGNNSDTLTISGLITVNSLPAVAVTQNGNLLTSTPGFMSYQWFLDSLIITGETLNTLTVSQNGTYYVQVTDSNGCDTAVTFVYNNVGLNESTTADSPFKIAPNPAKDFFIFSMNSSRKSQNYTTCEIEIINALGKNMFSGIFNLHEDRAISTAIFLPGIYFVKVHTENRFFFQKLIIE